MSCVQRTTAFSLLELIVVLVIVSLLVSLAGLTLRSHLEHATLLRAQAVASQADRFCRQAAQRSPAGTVELVLDSRKNSLVVRPVGRRFTLPAGTHLAEAVSYDSQRTTRIGRIQFNTPGVSVSYSLRLERGDSGVWVGFLGLSGQDVVLSDEDELREFFH